MHTMMLYETSVVHKYSILLYISQNTPNVSCPSWEIKSLHHKAWKSYQASGLSMGKKLAKTIRKPRYRFLDTFGPLWRRDYPALTLIGWNFNMLQKCVTYVGLSCFSKWMMEISCFYLILHLGALALRFWDHTDVRKKGQPRNF